MLSPNKTAKDKEVNTLATNKTASWALPVKNSGVAMIRAKIGMNTQVRLRKNIGLIRERLASSKQIKYKTNKGKIVLIHTDARINKRINAVFIRGSILCKSPGLKANSSEKTASLKKLTIPKRER